MIVTENNLDTAWSKNILQNQVMVPVTNFSKMLIILAIFIDNREAQ